MSGKRILWPPGYGDLGSRFPAGSNILFLDYFSVALAIIGALLLAGVNDSMSPLAVSLASLAVGMAFTACLGGGNYEYRNFLLSFGVCSLVAGLAQLYSQLNFGKPISTVDAITFENLIQHTYLQEMGSLARVVNAPLAVYVWKALYGGSAALGLDNGPWLGVLFNTLLVAVSGVFVTRAARTLFGNDGSRLKRLGNLYAACGLCWLLAALLVRDSFALFLNALVLWRVIAVLSSPGVLKMTTLAVCVMLSAWAMLYIRAEAVYVFLLVCFLAVLSWYLQSRFTVTKLVVIMLLVISALLAFGQITRQASDALQVSQKERDKYTQGSTGEARKGSLGVAYVVNQPTPVRAVIGSVYMVVNPIPLWGYFKPGTGEYHLILGYHGIYMLLLVPMVLAGAIVSLKNTMSVTTGRASHLFIVFYVLATLVLVAVTTLEVRHFAQFMPGMLLLAVFIGDSDLSELRRLKYIRLLWFGLVLLIHLAWFVLRSI